MRQTFSAETQAGPPELLELMADLRTYPHWLDVVSDVESTDDGEAWLVTLRARVGPFSRSKRLRMVRTVHTRAGHDGGSVRFERREIDGKNHSDWILAAVVEAVTAEQPSDDRGAGRSRVELDLVYDGTLWSGLLDGVLHAAADRATVKLQDYVSAIHR